MTTYRPREPIGKIDPKTIPDLDEFDHELYFPIYVGGGRLKQIATDDAKSVDDMLTAFREAKIGNHPRSKKYGKAFIERENGDYEALDMSKIYDIWTSDDGDLFCTLGVKIVGGWHGYIVCENGRLCRISTSKIFYTE